MQSRLGRRAGRSVTPTFTPYPVLLTTVSDVLMLPRNGVSSGLPAESECVDSLTVTLCTAVESVVASDESDSSPTVEAFRDTIMICELLGSALLCFSPYAGLLLSVPYSR